MDKLNRYSKEQAKRQAINLIRQANRMGSHDGCVRVWKGCTYEHERVKFDICFKLINDGFTVYTEAIFVNQARADIFAIAPNGDSYIIEVLNSETQERFLAKENYYPDVPIIQVHTKDFKIEDFKL